MDENNKFTKPNNIGISPKRQEAFIEFVRSLPRTCSPSIFMPSKCSQTKFEESSLSSHPKSLYDLNCSSNNDLQFNWSIDEYAMVYGQDFSNEYELEGFHSLIHTTMSKELDSENERYFSQEKILPSPTVNESYGTVSKSLLFRNEENISRNTGSFIRFLDSLPLHSTKYGDYNDYYDQQKSITKDVSMKEITNDIQEDVVKSEFQQISMKTDSDFVSMNEEQIELSLCSSYSANRNQKISFMDFSSWTPKFNNRCDFDNGQKIPIDKFIEDISPIMAPHQSCQLSTNHQQKKTNQIIRIFNEANKENSQKYFSSPINPLNCNTIKKRGFLSSSIRNISLQEFDFYKSNYIRKREDSPNIKCVKNIKETAEFETPQSSASKRRSKILRAKLLFNEFASTPNHSENSDSVYS